MPARAIALLSGGLDSMLAIRLLQEQGIEVEAVNFQTIFTCCRDDAARAARELGVRLTVLGQEDDYIELIRRPRYGYGKGANPCIDCRIYMFQRAGALMEQLDAQMVVSGEVVGQRPNSQKRRHLAIIAHEAGLEDRLLRPLSAKLLPPTLPEREGVVDRQRLGGYHGRGRKGLIKLARRFGFADIPSPSTGCSLTEKSFAGRVHDLIQLDPGSNRWDFELLNTGRHLRLDGQTKAIVGRNETENETLTRMYFAAESRAAALLTPHNFKGPSVMVIGDWDEQRARLGGGLVLRYAKRFDPQDALIRIDRRGEQTIQQMLPAEVDRVAELSTL
ncbi:MAG: hypothetical protein WDZ59_06525 [Pirellulales bacterium]